LDNSKPEREGLKDKLRRDWVDRFKTISLNSSSQSGIPNEGELKITSQNSLQMGWALHKYRRGNTRFSDKVREYLQKKFNIGQDSGRKEDPVQVAKDMRRACLTTGSPSSVSVA